MATTKTQHKQTEAKKQAEAPAAEAPTPQAPRYLVGPWPVKAQSGNSIRAFCYNVAQTLQKSKPEGFTVQELASEFAKQSKNSDFKQPSAGWGTPEKPNGNALSHANWFAHAKQGWLTEAEKAKAEAEKAQAKKSAEPAKTE